MTDDDAVMFWVDRPDAIVWRRLVARALDTVTVLMVMWVFGVLQLLWFVRSLADRFVVEPWGRALVPTLTFVFLSVAYETVFVRHNMGQTPGKDIMKLRVVRTRSPLTTGVILARAVIVSVPWLIPSVPLVAVLFVAGIVVVAMWPHAAVHDDVLGTRVVPFDRSREDPNAPPRPRFMRSGFRFLPDPHTPDGDQERQEPDDATDRRSRTAGGPT